MSTQHNKYKSIIKKLIENNKFSYSSLIKLKYPEILDYLIRKYPKLNGHPIREYCYWIINDLTDFPKCQHPKCANHTKFKNISLGYNQYCSRLCMQTDPLTEQKRILTNNKLYHVDHAQQSDIVKTIVKEKRKERIKLDPLYSKKQGDKIRNGLKRSANNDPDFWNKREEKTRKTKITNNKPPTWNNREKAKATVDQNKKNDPDYNKKIKEKRQKTIDKNKKNDPNYQKKITAKLRHTKVLHGHDEKWINVEKIKETKQLHFNDPYYRNPNKAKQTCLKLFGVESYSQTLEWAQRRSKKIYSKKFNIKFDSSWELIIYEFCIENNLNFIYQPKISFKYIFDGKIHYYHPDFIINDKLYEVKGDQFFKEDGTMFCPYRYKTWSDEKYINQCKLYEAKHQCMLTNNVTILKSNEIHNLQSILI